MGRLAFVAGNFYHTIMFYYILSIILNIQLISMHNILQVLTKLVQKLLSPHSTNTETGGYSMRETRIARQGNLCNIMNMLGLVLLSEAGTHSPRTENWFP